MFNSSWSHIDWANCIMMLGTRYVHLHFESMWVRKASKRKTFSVCLLFPRQIPFPHCYATRNWNPTFMYIRTDWCTKKVSAKKAQGKFLLAMGGNQKILNWRIYYKKKKLWLCYATIIMPWSLGCYRDSEWLPLCKTIRAYTLDSTCS